MSYFAGATIVNAAVFAFLALLVFIKNRESKINRIWAFSNIVISAWFGSIYLGEFVVRAEFVVLCIRSAFSLGLFGTLLLYHFVVLLTERVDRRKKILGVFYSVSFLLVVLMALFPRLVVEGVVERVGLPRVPVGGPLFLAEVIAVLTLMACILCDLFTAYRKATGYRRNQI
ncbi:MAG: hypothetical protein NT045_06180, partial [Candidatus Aureabacteria bacterium]|nr:hypothetical protein [Candidatus Auribacterota bacterium]